VRVEHAARVAGEIAHDGIELGERDVHRSMVADGERRAGACATLRRRLAARQRESP
jgi:hypothetical protein